MRESQTTPFANPEGATQVVDASMWDQFPSSNPSGISAEGAKPKRFSAQDAPSQQPMRADIKPAQQRKPSADQKRVRRQMSRQSTGDSGRHQQGQADGATPKFSSQSHHSSRTAKVEPHVLPVDGDPTSYEVFIDCRYCGQMISAEVKTADFLRWKNGAFAQDAFPHLAPDVREALFISGVCDQCFGKIARRTGTPKSSALTSGTTTFSTNSKERIMSQSSQQTEAQLLQRLAAATTLTEQSALTVQIDSLRATRREHTASASALDWGNMGALPPTREQQAAQRFASLPKATGSTRLGTSTDTDWLDDMAPSETSDNVLSAKVRAEAIRWFEGVWAPVKQDRQEFSAQAHNASVRISTQFGLQSTAAQSVFLDQVKHLASREGISLIAARECSWTRVSEPGEDDGLTWWECSTHGKTEMGGETTEPDFPCEGWLDENSAENPYTGSRNRSRRTALETTVDTYASDGKTSQPVGVEPETDSLDEWTIGTDLNGGTDPKSTNSANAPSLSEGDTPEQASAEGIDNPNFGQSGVDKSTYNVGDTSDRMSTQGGLTMKIAGTPWPLKANPNFPGEQMAACPTCGGDVVMESTPGPSGVQGMPGGGTTLICEQGHRAFFPKEASAKQAGTYAGGSPKHGDTAVCHADGKPIEFFDGAWYHLKGGPSHNDVWPGTPKEIADGTAMGSRRIASDGTCPGCGDPVETLDQFPGGYDLKCWSAIQEGQPLPTAKDIVEMWGGTYHGQKASSRRTAGIDVSKVRIEDRAGNLFSGETNDGTRVTFRLSDSDAKDVRSVMFGDLAQNFSGLTIEESDIVTEQGGGNSMSGPSRSASIEQHMAAQFGSTMGRGIQTHAAEGAPDCPTAQDLSSATDSDRPGGGVEWGSTATRKQASTTCKHCGNDISKKTDPTGQRGEAWTDAPDEINSLNDTGFQCGLSPSGQHEPGTTASKRPAPTHTLPTIAASFDGKPVSQKVATLAQGLSVVGSMQGQVGGVSARQIVSALVASREVPLNVRLALNEHLAGTSVEVASLPTCDICQQRPAAYDGKTVMGPWANMCGLCFGQHGIGLGTGRGQELVVKAGRRTASADYDKGFAEGKADHASGKTLTGWPEGVSEDFKRGWGDGYEEAANAKTGGRLRRQAAEGQTCGTCGDAIAKDADGSYHHDNGEKHDHEAKPGGELREGKRVPFVREAARDWGTASSGLKPGDRIRVEVRPTGIDGSVGADRTYEGIFTGQDSFGFRLTEGDGTYNNSVKREFAEQDIVEVHKIGSKQAARDTGHAVKPAGKESRLTSFAKRVQAGLSRVAGGGYGYDEGTLFEAIGNGADGQVQRALTHRDLDIMGFTVGASRKQANEGPTSTWPCQDCGTTVERWRGEYNVSCPNCDAQYNAGGQRLRDDWRGNASNWDSEVGDMEGYENQYAYEASRRTASGGWIAQFAGVGEDVWSGNNRVFATPEEAATYASNLLDRWFGADIARVVPEGTPIRQQVDLADLQIVRNVRTSSRKTAGGSAVAEDGTQQHTQTDRGDGYWKATCKNCGGSIRRKDMASSGWTHQTTNTKWCPEGTTASRKQAGFWEDVDAMLAEVASSGKTADDVIRILNGYGNPSSGDAFFPGSGGDASLMGALVSAGWKVVWAEADYYYVARQPDGNGLLTYVEGDVYRGDTTGHYTATKTAMPNPLDHGVDVGSIFYSSWGYDQTNIDFYEVVGVTGASVRIVPIESSVVGGVGGPQEKVVPVPGTGKGAPILKRMSVSGSQVFLSMNSFSNAYLWDGTPKSRTGHGWGH